MYYFHIIYINKFIICKTQPCFEGCPPTMADFKPPAF